MTRIFLSLARRLWDHRRQVRPQTCRRGRLRLEVLEDRLAPAVYVVNSTGDTGQGSGRFGDLRYTLTQADLHGGPNLILFDPSVFGTPQTITMKSALPALTDDHLAIAGPGSNLLTVSGDHRFRVFRIPAANVDLAGLTITAGVFRGNGAGIDFTGAGVLAIRDSVITGNEAIPQKVNPFGGGLYNASGTVEVSHSTLSGNYAVYGGGIASSGTVNLSDSYLGDNFAAIGGGVENFGTLTVTNSTLSGNYATYFSGGVTNQGTMTVTGSTLTGNYSYFGGGILNSNADNRLTVTNSTLSGNYATLGAGGIFNGGMLTLTASTLSGNSAGVEGGGITSNYISTGTLINSTLSGNSAGSAGGGICNDTGTLTLTNTTLSGNSSQKGGGIVSYAGGMLTLNNTLVAANRASASGPDVLGAVAGTSGFNLIGDGTGMTGISNGLDGNQVGTAVQPIDPRLAPLGNFGGPTQTMKLLADSPAINAGSNVLAVDQHGNTLQTDQRGLPRIVDGTVDIGAVEFQGPAGSSAPGLVHLRNAFAVRASSKVGSWQRFRAAVPALDVSEPRTFPSRDSDYQTFQNLVVLPGTQFLSVQGTAEQGIKGVADIQVTLDGPRMPAENPPSLETGVQTSASHQTEYFPAWPVGANAWNSGLWTSLGEPLEGE